MTAARMAAAPMRDRGLLVRQRPAPRLGCEGQDDKAHQVDQRDGAGGAPEAAQRRHQEAGEKRSD